MRRNWQSTGAPVAACPGAARISRRALLLSSAAALGLRASQGYRFSRPVLRGQPGEPLAGGHRFDPFPRARPDPARCRPLRRHRPPQPAQSLRARARNRHGHGSGRRRTPGDAPPARRNARPSPCSFPLPAMRSGFSAPIRPASRNFRSIPSAPAAASAAPSRRLSISAKRAWRPSPAPATACWSSPRSPAERSAPSPAPTSPTPSTSARTAARFWPPAGPPAMLGMFDAASGKLVVRLPLPIEPRHFSVNSDGGQVFLSGAGDGRRGGGLSVRNRNRRDLSCRPRPRRHGGDGGARIF